MKKVITLIILSFVLSSLVPLLQAIYNSLSARYSEERSTIPQASQLPERKKDVTVKTFEEENVTPVSEEGEKISFQNLIIVHFHVLFYGLALVIALYGIYSMVYTRSGGQLTRFISRLKGAKILLVSAITGILGAIVYSLSIGLILVLILLSIMFVINTILLIFIYLEEDRIIRMLEKTYQRNDAKLS